jgi:predicted transposase YdaD
MQEGLKEGLKEGIQKGIQEGMEKGIQEGILEGKKEEQRHIARQAMIMGLGIENIKMLTGLSEEEINNL